MLLIGVKSNRKVKQDITFSQILIYSSLLLLVIFLLTNAFYLFVSIPVLLYAIFYVVILSTSFLVFMNRRKDRIEGIKDMLINWDEYTGDNRQDYVNIIKNEIETNYHSILGQIANGNILKILIYIFLVSLIAKVGLEDKTLTSRLFFVSSLSILFVLIMLTQVSIVKDLQKYTSISQKEFLLMYSEKLEDNYKFLLIFIIIFILIMAFFIIYNISIGVW